MRFTQHSLMIHLNLDKLEVSLKFNKHHKLFCHIHPSIKIMAMSTKALINSVQRKYAFVKIRLNFSI